jgi:hypothetical protein
LARRRRMSVRVRNGVGRVEGGGGWEDHVHIGDSHGKLEGRGGL